MALSVDQRKRMDEAMKRTKAEKPSSSSNNTLVYNRAEKHPPGEIQDFQLSETTTKFLVDNCSQSSQLQTSCSHLVDNSKISNEINEFLKGHGLGDVDSSNIAEIITKTSEKEFEPAYLERACLQLVYKLSTSCLQRLQMSTCLQMSTNQKRNLADEVRDWVLCADGTFKIDDIFRDLAIKDRTVRKNVSVYLFRLKDEGLIEKDGTIRGVYRVVSSQCEAIDWQNASTDTLDIRWPFEIERYVETMPGNIVCIAGEPNAGKTGFLLNVVEMNMDRHEVHYFNSEMGSSELRKRLERFSPIRKLDAWNFHAWERSSSFADVIRPDAINIIDFLEIHNDFWRIGGMLKEIHDKLKLGICVVALQKNRGRDEGLGGSRGLEKPRLYLAMEPGKCRIVKGKNWRTSENPNGLICEYKLHSGCHFYVVKDWHRPEVS